MADIVTESAVVGDEGVIVIPVIAGGVVSMSKGCNALPRQLFESEPDTIRSAVPV